MPGGAPAVGSPRLYPLYARPRLSVPGQIRREPERVLAAIKKALASAAGRPALDIRTVPAS